MVSPRVLKRLVWAVFDDALRLLADWAVGPRCGTCGERRRGPRTLARHIDLDHAGDPA